MNPILLLVPLLVAWTLAGGAAFAQTPLDAFTRSRASDPGFGPENNGSSCAFCHTGVFQGVNTVGFAGPAYRASFFYRPASGGPVSVLYRFTAGSGEPPNPTFDYQLSRRAPTSLFGLGLVELVDDATIEALADPFDLDADGISGIVQYKGGAVARFGTQLCHATLDSAVADALTTEFGIEPAQHNPADVALLLQYVRGLPPPPPEVPLGTDPDVDNGALLFDEIGCAGCHTPELPLPGGGTIAAYSDFLLHDMGRGLDDSVGLCNTAGPQWRTVPLWGPRTPYVLHDGRITRAQFGIIMKYHGGEATGAANAYFGLSTADQGDVREFVETR